MPAECYELTLSGILSGQFVQNVFHVNVDNSASTNPYTVAVDVNAMVNQSGQFIEKFMDCVPGDYKATSLRCRRVLPTGGPTAITLGAGLSEDTGQRSGSIQAAQVNPVIVLITTIRPNKTGRCFLPGVSETDMDDMVYTAGLISAINDLIVQFTDASSLPNLTYTANFAILRRASGNSDDITAARLSPLVGTQRRRLRPV